jgi:hypothetical protein
VWGGGLGEGLGLGTVWGTLLQTLGERERLGVVEQRQGSSAMGRKEAWQRRRKSGGAVSAVTCKY